VQTVSRRAVHLWEGRDGPSVLQGFGRSKSGSVVSSHARTVVGLGSRPVHPLDNSDEMQEDHGIPCSACAKVCVSYLFHFKFVFSRGLAATCRAALSVCELPFFSNIL
jgi:hypothetical protein